MSDDRVGVVEKLVDALRSRINTLADFTHGGMDGLELEAELEQNGSLLSRIEDLEHRLGEIEPQLEAIQDLGQEKTTKEEKVAALVQFAQNTATDAETDRVVIKAREIKGLAGVSRRYAYDLIDDLPGEYDWLHDRSTVSQFGDLQIDKDSQVKALIVDLEQLHSDAAAVNKFTTRTSRKGASA